MSHINGLVQAEVFSQILSQGVVFLYSLLNPLHRAGLIIWLGSGDRIKRDNENLLVIFRAMLFACQTKKIDGLKM